MDELLCDPQLTRERVERHLAGSEHEPSLLDGEYVCLTSGGSSGLRGIFVQTLDEFVEFVASLTRRAMARVIASGGPPPGGVPIGIVAAASPVHSSGFGAAVATGYPVRLISAPATLPLPQLVERLNEIQPPALMGHTSKLVLLAGERAAGRLRIAPLAITAISETVTAEDRRAIEHAFGLPLITQFNSTEGLVGHSDPGEAVLSFATDTCLVELVDANDQPVPHGTPSAKALITNLHNRTQPLIRYELTDRLIGRPSGPHTPFPRASVEGRADDMFNYGELTIDPLVIRTVMVRTPAALEYQVRQTDRGIDIAIIAQGELDRVTLASSLERSLRNSGLREPRVRVHEVADIARHPETGKARRFIPR